VFPFAVTTFWKMYCWCWILW